jgi:2'-5' RNA ligase
LLPAPVSTEVDGLRRAVGDGSLRRIPAHLTLVPPVNVAEARLPEALGVLRRAAAATRSLTLELGPPRTFLPDSPVLYLAVEGEVTEVHALRGRVMRDPLARTTSWPFVPHVTLADSASPEVIEAAVTALGRYRAEVRFDRVHLLRESADRGWEPIAEAPLRPPAVIGRGGLPVELSVTVRLDPEATGFVEQSEGAGRPFAVTARREQQVVGVATGFLRDGVTHLDTVLVDVGQRRQGIGSHLLAAVESLAAAKGCPAIVADEALEGVADTFLRSRGWASAPARPQLRRDPSSGGT